AAAGRADRRSGPRSRLRQPWLPARRHRAGQTSVQREAMDRLPAAVSRLEADEAVATRAVHRAVLPRRGDGLLRGSPSVRALSPERLRPLRRALAGAASGPARRRRDRRTAPRGTSRCDDAPAAPSPRVVERPARSHVRLERGSAVTRARQTPPALDARGLRGAHAASGTRRRGCADAAIAGRGARARLERPRAARPSHGAIADTLPRGH